MRTENSLRNVAAGLSGQALSLAVSFIGRRYFTSLLGKEYLGLNGLFTNLLTMLSLVELGIGPAIIYSLYKPLAERDHSKIKALMALYRKAYTAVGVLILLLGALLSPFLRFIITDMPELPHLHLIFLMFVCNSALSYFFSYKRSLIIADQKQYITTLYHYAFFILMNLAQILILILTKNYLLYLAAQIASTGLENFCISRRANRLYPFLLEKTTEKVDAPTMGTIKRNIFAMIFHKIGGIVVDSTDNILISAMVGTVWVGLYSNYQLILQALRAIFNQFFDALTASVGNLGVMESKEHSLWIFEVLAFAGFWIYGFCAIAFYQLCTPFITLWLGKDLLLSEGVALVLAANFYIRGMRQAIFTFRDAFGLYWYDRYKPLVEITVNLAVSCALAPRFGIAGVFIGTFVSTVTVCLWVEPLVLYHHAFSRRAGGYFLRYARYTAIVLLAGALTRFCCSSVPFSGFTELFVKGLICLFVPNAIFLLSFCKSKELHYVLSKLSVLLHSILKRMKHHE